MDKIYAMKLFVRVAERESFSRAAEDIGLPKGSVSRQIQALEHQLGIRLLHRTTRRVQLTQDGMVYYERAKDLLSNLDELEGLFQPDPASISGKIRVDIPPCLANSLIMPRLPTFLHQYPGIALELCSSDRQVGRFRLCGAYRAATCAGDTDAPAWQTEKGELRQPTIPGALWVSRKP